MDQDPPVWLIPAVVIFVVGILGLCALVFIPLLVRVARNARMAQQVMQTGVDATATIVRIWETNVRTTTIRRSGCSCRYNRQAGHRFKPK